MNDNLDMYEVEVGQSNKGIWYCKSLKICNSKIMVVSTELDDLIGEVDGVLYKNNKGVEALEPPKK